MKIQFFDIITTKILSITKELIKTDQLSKIILEERIYNKPHDWEQFVLKYHNSFSKYKICHYSVFLNLLIY